MRSASSRVEAAAVVGDAERDVVLDGRRGQHDLGAAAVGDGADRVADEVYERLLERGAGTSARPRAARPRPGCCAPAASASGASRSRVSASRRSTATRSRRLVRVAAPRAASGRRRSSSSRIERAGLAPHERHVLVVARDHAVEHRLGVAVDHLQRRAQLVPQLVGELDARAARRRRARRARRRARAAARSRQISSPSMRASISSSACSSALKRARLAVVQAERAEPRPVGQRHVARAEGEDVPVDAEPLLQLQPVLPDRRHLARVRDDRAAPRARGRASRGSPRTGSRRRARSAGRSLLEPAEDVAAVAGDLGDDVMSTRSSFCASRPTSAIVASAPAKRAPGELRDGLDLHRPGRATVRTRR